MSCLIENSLRVLRRDPLKCERENLFSGNLSGMRN